MALRFGHVVGRRLRVIEGCEMDELESIAERFQVRAKIYSVDEDLLQS